MQLILKLSIRCKLNYDRNKNQRYIHTGSLLSENHFTHFCQYAQIKILFWCQNYLGSKPYLTGLQVYGNIKNSTSAVKEGSKLWHRDGNVLQKQNIILT